VAIGGSRQQIHRPVAMLDILFDLGLSCVNDLSFVQKAVEPPIRDEQGEGQKPVAQIVDYSFLERARRDLNVARQ
jgi:hypothetical protein